MNKEELKEQLKKQQEVKATQTLPPDIRNHGLNRIYFFQRLSDNYIFPIDAELQAHHLMRRKDFNQKYRYLGWSKGEYLNEFKRGGSIAVKFADGAQVSEEGKEIIKEKTVLINEILEKELEAALDNPDKTLPRDFRAVDLNGNIANSQITSWLNMMR